jgi:predicted ATPase
MRTPCACDKPFHTPRLIVLTGGPGAGKTAVLEVVQRELCEHVLVLPETASILFGGGFPRHDTDSGRRAAQRAIYRVQLELERMALEEQRAAVVLCDRGTVDGCAYWPGAPTSFWAEVGTTREAQLARYAAVIHLRTPPADGGYNHQNPVRIETAEQAAEVDAKILEAWRGHPRRVVLESRPTFLDKLAGAIEAIRAEVPPCCRTHASDAAPDVASAAGLPVIEA